MARGTRVCPKVGCPHIVTPDTPCPVHPPRDRNASWSTNRDAAQHARWARAVKERDGHQCVRCGATKNLHAHHIRPGWDLDAGITLCAQHHRETDSNAR